MQISYVVPAYNEAESIVACLNAIRDDLARSGAAGEIVVVNNASTDATRQRALSVPDVRVVDEPRKGLGRARQTGHEATTGELVANIDADNILPPGWTARALSAFRRHPKLVGLSGPLVYYDLPLRFRVMTLLFMVGGFVCHGVGQYVFRSSAVMQGGNFVVRRRALDAAGGYHTGLTFYGEDTETACRLVPMGRVMFSFRLPIWSSGRRLAVEGVRKTGWRYMRNFLSVALFRRPVSQTHQDVRLQR